MFTGLLLNVIYIIKFQINPSILNLIKRDEIGINPSLSYLNLNRTLYEEVKFQWIKHNRLSISSVENIPIFHCSTLPLENEFEVPRKRAKPNSSKDSIKVEVDESMQINPSDDDNKKLTILEQSSATNNTNDMESYFDNDNNFDSDNGQDEFDVLCKTKDKADGSNLDEEYANMIPISLKEAQAAVEVYKMFSQGKYRCNCGKTFQNENRLVAHQRMHDTVRLINYFSCFLSNFKYY